MNRPLAIIALATVVAGAARAQDPAVAPGATAAPARPIVSLGQPWRWQPYVAAGAAFARSDDGGLGLVGVHRDLLNPLYGLLGVAAEGYGGVSTGAGLRLLARSRVFGLGGGVDWSATDNRFDALLSYQTAVRRGGLLGRGTMVRVDWLPTRDQRVIAGVTLPLWPRAGKTRSRETEVEFPRAPGYGRTSAVPASAETALRDAERLAGVIASYTNLYTKREEWRLQRASESWREAERSYHRAVVDAFVAATGARPAGEAAAARAREVLLDEVLLPYDREFGRSRGGAGSFRRLGAAARARFDAWLRDSSTVAPAARESASATFSGLVSVVERLQAEVLADAGDSRSVWLPLQLALRASEYDEQRELDALISRAIERDFTDGNALTYLRSGDMPLEIARSIYAARDYHVLWMHDFAGRPPSSKRNDAIAYELVADAYLPALTEAVKRYDASGVLPVYMIMLDEFFYEPRDGRLWMSMLQDPLGASMKLPGRYADREAHLRERQAELRAAVAASNRLQREAVTRGGRHWLGRVVKVHVNITFPSDFSFRSFRIVPGIPFTPDNVMRDHRKFVFYDLNEADPYRGALMLTGVGVGEHYASATWEDRGYRVRGPAALEARAALRRLLALQGFRPADVPPPLREVKAAHAPAPAPSVDGRNVGDGASYVGRAVQLHNEPGWGPKRSSLARAILNTLAEPGSVVVVPDPLWASREWAGMLAGAAVRGAQVQVIAPALENAPSPQAPLMALSHDVMARLLALRTSFAPRIAAAGGALRVGLFASTVPVTNAEGRAQEIRAGLARAPWLRTMIPFDARTLAVLTRTTTRTAADPDATDVAKDEKPRPPQLHQKTQLVARPGALAALARQTGWEDALARAMETQSTQTARFAEQLGFTTPATDEGAARSNDALLAAYERAVPEAERERLSFYFLAGTQNQDPRGLMLDGEAMLLTSGFSGAAGLVDLYFLMARATWLESTAQLDTLLPPRRFWGRVGRLIRPTL